MTLALEPRLRALAEQELEESGRAPRAQDEPMAELQRLESQIRALFLFEEHDIAEVRSLLASHHQAWLALVRSDETSVVWSGSERPQFSEFLMALCDGLLGGLLEAIAIGDEAAVTEFRSRFVQRALPEFELPAATMLLARQLCFLFGHEFERAAKDIGASWDEWVEFDLVHPRDDVWSGVRGIANNDAELVQASLRGLSRRRLVALRHAAESGRMLRSTLPVRLTLQTDSGALVRLARMRGMEIPLTSEDLLTRRAALLWGLEE
jgi:hypothetical protein